MTCLVVGRQFYPGKTFYQDMETKFKISSVSYMFCIQIEMAVGPYTAEWCN